MGFADWVKRSDLAATALSRYGSLRRVLQAAYKAGERDGSKQTEAVAENAVRLAVTLERDACQQACRDLAKRMKTMAEKDAANSCAEVINMRSNV